MHEEVKTEVVQQVSHDVEGARRSEKRQGEVTLPTWGVFLGASAATLVGMITGILLGQVKCEETAWYNPFAAYRLTVSAQHNPLLLLFAPEATEALKVASGALVTSAMGALGMATTRVKSAICKEEGEERSKASKKEPQKRLKDAEAAEKREEEDAVQMRDSARKRKKLKDLVQELEENGVYEQYRRFKFDPQYLQQSRREERAPARVIELLPQRVGREREPPDWGVYGTPKRQIHRLTCDDDVSSELARTPIKVVYGRDPRREMPSPSRFGLPTLSMMLPRGGVKGGAQNGGCGGFQPWEPAEYRTNRALIF